MFLIHSEAATATKYKQDWQGYTNEVTPVDKRPMDGAPGSTFYCYDTGDSYVFDGTVWWPV